MQSGYVLTVTQLNEYVAGLLQREVLLRSLSVRGEVSGLKRHSSGHVYFTLKDGGALVRCVMFRQDAMQCGVAFSDGMEIVAQGHAALYARDGQYQLYVKTVTGEGEGELYRRFLMMKTRLQARGWFDEAHKKPIPALPRRRFPAMNLLLGPVAVQGMGAAEEIAAGIRLMNRLKRADVLIVGRGGGSLEDLWAFNEETVAEAIYESEIPIVSAVGHETDFSIADFVADLRAPTPSAAAELCVPEYDTLLSTLDGMRETLLCAARTGLLRRRERVNAIVESGAFSAPRHALADARHTVLDAGRRLDAAAQASLAAAVRMCSTLSGKLEALSPAHTLARGFALVRGKDGAYCGSVERLSPDDSVTIMFHDGAAGATVNTIEKEQRQNGEKKAEL